MPSGKSYELTIPENDPSQIKPYYYKTHVGFFLGVFKKSGVKVDFNKALKYLGNSFEVVARSTSSGKTVKFLMDFGDSKEVNSEGNKYPFVLKTHVSLSNKKDKIIPFSPISFYDWERADFLFEKCKYVGKDTLILNNQRPYAGAKERRERVQEVLRRKYGNLVDTDFSLPQEKFWERISKCRLAVLVPGFREDIFDRSHGELFYFGCPVISPNLDIYLSPSNVLTPGLHYIRCKTDYSDLTEVIDAHYNDRGKLYTIGNNARVFYNSNLSAEATERRFSKALQGYL